MTAFDNLVEYLQQCKNSYDCKNATFNEYYLPSGNNIKGEHKRVHVQIPDLDNLQRRINSIPVDYKYNEEEKLDIQCIKFVYLIHQFKLITLHMFCNTELPVDVKRFLASYIYIVFQILKQYAAISDIYWRFRNIQAYEYAEMSLDIIAVKNSIEFYNLITSQFILGRGIVIE
jgi:hypothetical protein